MALPNVVLLLFCVFATTIITYTGSSTVIPRHTNPVTLKSVPSGPMSPNPHTPTGETKRDSSFREPEQNLTFKNLFAFCDASVLVPTMSLACVLGDEDVFSFNEFRTWSSKHQTVPITLDIKCINGGTVNLPWPYRSHNLVSLKVDGCFTDGYYSEMMDEALLNTIEDKLENISITNSVQLLDVTSQFQAEEQLASGNLSLGFECGPLKLKYNIERNISIKLKEFDYSAYDDLLLGDSNSIDSTTPHSRDTTSIDSTTPQPGYDEREARRQKAVLSSETLKHVCDYQSWEYYEFSYQELGTFHLKGLVGNSNFPNMKSINFTNARQRFIQPEILKWRLHFPKLETVDMSYSSISEFHFTDYTNGYLPRGYIDLQFNNITSLGKNEIASFQNLQSTFINIHNNPFHCDCESMTRFNEFLLSHDGPKEAKLLPDYKYLWLLTCSSPERFSGRVISKLTKEIICNQDVLMYEAYISILSALIVLLLIVIIVLARYRQEIRILVFTRLHVILPCPPKEDDLNYPYDAFISYSSGDTKWVIESLAEKLEDTKSGPGLKLCLHHRDFEVGEYICNNIIDSVAKSRHTVLIVSKHFLKSEWCVFEFREALHKSLLEKRKHLIMILVEDIPVETLESDFKKCMDMVDCIKLDDKLFWDRLQYALARKHCIGTSIDEDSKPTPARLDSQISTIPLCEANYSGNISNLV